MYTMAAQEIFNSGHAIAFTGAGISVESGIPPFRGKNGLYDKYDPKIFEIDYFRSFPDQSWTTIRQIFYQLFGNVSPNAAHWALAELEANNKLNCVITQNIDNLHYEAGSKKVYEFHGSLRKLVCMNCNRKYQISRVDLNSLPPICTHCKNILKPDVIFFGESINTTVKTQAFKAAQKADCILIIGTTGTVSPANMIPAEAKSNGAVVIEINPHPSEYTRSITDIFIQETAAIGMEGLMEEIDTLI